MNSYPEKPFFSIIIPTFNHAHLISKCLDSVVGQSFSNWEAIIVNNFSEDNTESVVESYTDERIKLLNYRNNGVIGASRNYGVQNSAGKWICFLDSDDWYATNRLEVLSKIDLDKYDLIYHPLVIYQNGEVNSKTPVRQLNKRDPYKDLLYNLNTIGTSSTCIRRDFFLNCHGFSEKKELIGVEDFDLWIRLAKSGMKAKLVNLDLGYYYVGESNITYKDERQIARLNAVYQSYISDPGKLSGKKIQGALFYLIARVYLANRKSKTAMKYFFNAFLSGSAAIKLRSIYYLVNILGR